ncbi:MAG: Holliday junction resolvase RuvX [Verrucomicrobiota bacterium]
MVPVVKRLLGIDFGKARIGLAISDELGFMSHPLETLRMSNLNEVAKRIGEIVREKKIERVVVGLPRNMDGSHGPAAEEALAFVAKLRGQLACDVITWDERLTTVSANRALRAAGRSTRETRGYIDQVAAQVILQGYLDRLQAIAASEMPPIEIEPD